MKKFEVIWTKYAELDLELIIEYIKMDSVNIANWYFKYRELIYKRWRIIYKIDNTKVYVLLVADTSRNLEDILFQRLIKRDGSTNHK